jgi:sulfate adenylyltransferase subunit 1
VEQTRRHAAVAALLRVPHVVLAVNKMDLVDYTEPVFAAIAEEFTHYATTLGVPQITAIPICALAGDNVVTASAHMDWYGGPTVLEHLETVPVGTEQADAPARFPVQYVIRPHTPEHHDYRGYAGQIASGLLRVGQPVTILPSGQTSTIASIDALGAPVEVAWAPQSVTLTLADDLDISRGDLIAPASDAPALTQDITATVCHLHERPLRSGERVLLKHGTRTVKAIVKDLPARIDVTSFDRDTGLARVDDPGELAVNDIGSVVLRTAQPLPVDAYADSRRTGAFILIDPADGQTLTAGMAGEAFPIATTAPAPLEADDEWDF